MLGENACSAITNKGKRCLGRCLPDSDYCTFHDPRHEESVQQGRQIGGQRRKRQSSLAAVYDVTGTRTMEDLRRLLDIAAFDALALDSSVPKVRALVAIVLAGTKVKEVGDHEDRLLAIEAALGPRALPGVRRNR